jgi:hypothetical protein
MRNPRDWTKVVGPAVIAAFWASMAIFRDNLDYRIAHFVVAGLFAVVAI